MISETASMIIYIVMNFALIFAYYNFVYKPEEPKATDERLEFVKYALSELLKEYKE